MSEGWRKLEMKDVKHGVTVRITGMQDTVYNGATIIRISSEVDTFSKRDNLIVTLARPFAYANAEFESKQPMCGCEVFDMCIKEVYREEYAQWVCQSDLEVYEGRGELRSMLTYVTKNHD